MGENRRYLSPQQIEEARSLYRRGWTLKMIADLLGFRAESIKRAVDPQWAEHRRQQINEARGYRERTGRRSENAGREAATRLAVKADGAARLAEIPPDTRTLTGRFFGDPLPNDPRRRLTHGRSPA